MILSKVKQRIYRTANLIKYNILSINYTMNLCLIRVFKSNYVVIFIKI